MSQWTLTNQDIDHLIGVLYRLRNKQSSDKQLEMLNAKYRLALDEILALESSDMALSDVQYCLDVVRAIAKRAVGENE